MTMKLPPVIYLGQSEQSRTILERERQAERQFYRKGYMQVYDQVRNQHPERKARIAAYKEAYRLRKLFGPLAVKYKETRTPIGGGQVLMEIELDVGWP